MALESGHRLGRYEVRSLVGAGGMGEVYLAHDTKLERKVALKLLLARYTTSEDRLRRFSQEARAASGLNHPNIVTVHDVDVHDGTHYITTEFVEGETLRGRSAPRARPAVGSVCRSRPRSPTRCRRASRRHRPPRHQAREHHGAARRLREGAGLRAREARRDAAGHGENTATPTRRASSRPIPASSSGRSPTCRRSRRADCQWTRARTSGASASSSTR